jgi:hypothetical protein
LLTRSCPFFGRTPGLMPSRSAAAGRRAHQVPCCRCSRHSQRRWLQAAAARYLAAALPRPQRPPVPCPVPTCNIWVNARRGTKSSRYRDMAKAPFHTGTSGSRPRCCARLASIAAPWKQLLKSRRPSNDLLRRLARMLAVRCPSAVVYSAIGELDDEQEVLVSPSPVALSVLEDSDPSDVPGAAARATTATARSVV